MATIEELKNNVLDGGEISHEEAILLSETDDREALFDAAGEITRHFGKPTFNPCSIINAKAGKCSENCKWCAQSGHYHTKAELRFAGGRGRLSHEVQLKALKIGINAAVVGDLLTTVGSKIDDDRKLASEAGYAQS